MAEEMMDDKADIKAIKESMVEMIKWMDDKDKKANSEMADLKVQNKILIETLHKTVAALEKKVENVSDGQNVIKEKVSNISGDVVYGSFKFGLICSSLYIVLICVDKALRAN